MSLSQQTITALIDLLENKLSCMTIADREDMQHKVALLRARCELSSLAGLVIPDAAFIDMPRRGRRRRLTES
jgi:hypothetical protein